MMRKRIRRYIKEGKGRPRFTPAGHNTTVIAARMARPLIDKIDFFRHLEHRTRANMIEVMLERYMRCPSCQQRGERPGPYGHGKPNRLLTEVKS